MSDASAELKDFLIFHFARSAYLCVAEHANSHKPAINSQTFVVTIFKMRNPHEYCFSLTVLLSNWVHEAEGDTRRWMPRAS